jgi:hypothetical protein
LTVFRRRHYNKRFLPPQCSSVAQRQSIRLLTGGLLVRIQPEEPNPFGNSTTFACRRTALVARCPFLALSLRPVFVGAEGGPVVESSRPTSAERCSGDRCAYRMTIRSPRWPNNSATDRSEAPFMISHEANVCRRSCQVKSLISAVSRAVRNAILTSSTGSPTLRPVACGKEYGQSGIRWLYSACSVVSTVALSGNACGRPLLVRWIRRTRLRKST